MGQFRYQGSVEFPDAKFHSITPKTSWDTRDTAPKPTSTLEDTTIATLATPRIQHPAGQPDMETYNGHVRTPADAIILFEACRLGLLPRVQRRLSEKERQSIKSGSVFVWDEREAGMRRWTDGKSWSASRVSGSFLTYREMEGKRGGNNFGPPLAAVSRAGKTPDSTRGSDSDLDVAGEDGPDGYRYKPDGLMKQSFSITTSSGNHLHLISYYSRSHPAASNLNSPTSDPQLRHIRPAKGMYPESTVHEHQSIPAVTRSPMASAPYSTVPQMAGYARQNPPQWAPHYNGYGWAPPSIPQGPHYGYQYGGGAGHYAGGPPPPTNGHSPLSHSHSVPQPSASQPPASQPHDSHMYDQRRFPPTSGPVDPNMAAYDPRRGAPTIPQQQPHQQQYDTYRQPPDPNLPMYDPRLPPNQYRNGPSTPTNHLAPSSQYNNQASNSANGMQPMPYPQSQNHNPSPHTSQPTPNVQQQQQQHIQPTQHAHPANSSSTPIDPRLFGPPSVVKQGSQIHSHSATPTPAAPTQDNNIDNTPSHTNGTPQANTIPSIGSIMNGASAENSNSPNTDAKSDKSGDRTPGGSVKKESGPQDIPSDKLGFGEDMRALKVLDRAFKT